MSGRLWQQLSTTLTGGAVLIGAASIASRLFGLVRDRLLAATFGGSGALDPYYAAFKVPDLIFNILVLGALSSSFIPVFIEQLRKTGDGVKPVEAWRMANSVLNALVLTLFVLAGLFFIFADRVIPLITPGFGAEQLDLTVRMTRIMLLAILFFGVSNILSGVLNAFKRFFAFSLAPIFYNLGIIVGIVAFVPHAGVLGLAYGVVLGAGLHLLVQLPGVVRVGFRYRFLIDWKDRAFRQVFRLMLPRTFGLAVNQIDKLVFTIIASTLPAGSLTVFNLADNLQNVPINVFGVSLAIAAFPYFSEAFAQGSNEKFVGHFSQTVRRILFLVIPASVLILLLRAQIVRVVLGAHAFDWTATYLTAQVLGFFSLSLVAQALLPVLARSFYAHQDTKTPVRIGLVAVALNVTLSLIFSHSYGVIGLALAFSLSNLANALTMLGVLRGRFGNLGDRQIVVSTLKILLATLGMAVIVQLAKVLVASGVDMHTFVGIFLQGAVSATVGIVSFFVFALLLKTEEVRLVGEWMSRFRRALTINRSS